MISWEVGLECIGLPLNADDLYEGRTRTMTAADATQLAGEAYRTRRTRGERATPADKTRIAQEG